MVKLSTCSLLLLVHIDITRIHNIIFTKGINLTLNPLNLYQYPTCTFTL